MGIDDEEFASDLEVKTEYRIIFSAPKERGGLMQIGAKRCLDGGIAAVLFPLLIIDFKNNPTSTKALFIYERALADIVERHVLGSGSSGVGQSNGGETPIDLSPNFDIKNKSIFDTLYVDICAIRNQRENATKSLQSSKTSKLDIFKISKLFAREKKHVNDVDSTIFDELYNAYFKGLTSDGNPFTDFIQYMVKSPAQVVPVVAKRYNDLRGKLYKLKSDLKKAGFDVDALGVSYI